MRRKMFINLVAFQQIIQNIPNSAFNELNFRDATWRKIFKRSAIYRTLDARYPQSRIPTWKITFAGETFMLTLKIVYKKSSLCKHPRGKHACAQRGDALVLRRDEKYYAICVQHKHSRTVDARYKYLYFMTLHILDTRAYILRTRLISRK